MELKSCPTCETKNAPNALVCYKCGSTFTSGSTLHIPQTTGRLGHADKVEKLTSVYTDSFVIFVAGDNRPLIVPRIQGKVLIGRSVPNSDKPHIDLMDYNAGLLGVSRLHAFIQHTEHGYVIQDNNSTNGTYLNDTRLLPGSPHTFHSGDKVRLGQMNLYIYYTETETTQQTFFLVNHDLNENTSQSLTTHTLSTLVSPFLRALGDLQKVCNQIIEREHEDVMINSIVVVRQNQSLSINVEHLLEAKTLVQDRVFPWKLAQTDAIDKRDPALQEAQKQLAYDIVDHVKDGLPDAARDRYAHQLMPIIQSLTFNPLAISTEQVTLETT